MWVRRRGWGVGGGDGGGYGGVGEVVEEVSCNE